ncbi:alpha/beta fold hydrolase [Paraburkholderia sp.]|uniref:alpha/beta hydrolase n=1 Tax=Paraburkholderia sp. TaxID=1926495 RepID=UPI0023A03CDA|nr:alpha/beta fold hydrolase [Paraburkholderia sp.]MDE1180455.1 alpha/beta fold hydrolase [Paraburkholderia sp.]
MRILQKLALVSLLWMVAVSALADQNPPGADDVLHDDLSLPYLLHVPQSGTKGAPLIVLLHGMGSNERDLYALKAAFPARFAIASARAPYTLGDDSYQWYRSTQVHGRLDGDPAQLDASRVKIAKLVDQLVSRYGFDSREVYLVGFSQGAIMSYEVALTNQGLVKGIGVMSGAIYESLVPQIKASFALSHLHVFISHGDADSRIPVAYAQSASLWLTRFGIKPALHVYPGMEHQISESALRDLVDWLSNQ